MTGRQRTRKGEKRKKKEKEGRPGKLAPENEERRPRKGIERAKSGGYWELANQGKRSIEECATEINITSSRITIAAERVTNPAGQTPLELSSSGEHSNGIKGPGGELGGND